MNSSTSLKRLFKYSCILKNGFFQSLLKLKASRGVIPLQAFPAVDIPKLSDWITVVVGKNSAGELTLCLGMCINAGRSAHNDLFAAAHYYNTGAL